MGTRGYYWGKIGLFAIYPPKLLKLNYFQQSMNQMTLAMSYIIGTQEQIFFSKN